jgi:hypothetical protein
MPCIDVANNTGAPQSRLEWSIMGPLRPGGYQGPAGWQEESATLVKAPNVHFVVRWSTAKSPIENGQSLHVSWGTGGPAAAPIHWI